MTDLPLLHPIVLTAAGLLGLAAFLLTLLAIGRLRRGRLLAGGGLGLAGVAFGLAAVVAGLVGGEFYTYHRLTLERPVAELVFRRLGPHHYQALLAPAGAPARHFDIYGDDWQLDARVLKWRGWALLLGAEPLYRLERFSGRYRRVDQELEDPRSVYALARDPGLDLWRLARRYRRWLPWVDAVYGSATYLPMADGARYGVWMTASGLLARPDNAPARQAVAAWP